MLFQIPFFLRWTLKSTRWNKIKNIIILLNYTFASYRYHLFSINFLLLERKGKLHRKIESLLVVIFAGSANYLFSIYSFEHRLLCISSFWHFDVHHYNLKNIIKIKNTYKKILLIFLNNKVRNQNFEYGKRSMAKGKNSLKKLPELVESKKLLIFLYFMQSEHMKNAWKIYFDKILWSILGGIYTYRVKNLWFMLELVVSRI